MVAGSGGPVPFKHPSVPLHSETRWPCVDQRWHCALGPGRGVVQQHRLERGPFKWWVSRSRQRHLLSIYFKYIWHMLHIRTSFSLYALCLPSLSIPAGSWALWVERDQESQIDRPYDSRVLERCPHNQGHRPKHIQDDQVSAVLKLLYQVDYFKWFYSSTSFLSSLLDIVSSSPSKTFRFWGTSWCLQGKRSPIRAEWRMSQRITATSVTWGPQDTMMANNILSWHIAFS